MSMTCITAEFLRKADACEEGVEWYDAHPEIHDTQWPAVCAALEEDGQEAWSMWVREAVAQFGTAEDRAVLRNDTHWTVRASVARFGSAEERAVLRNDPHAEVRRAAEYFERNDPK